MQLKYIGKDDLENDLKHGVIKQCGIDTMVFAGPEDEDTEFVTISAPTENERAAMTMPELKPCKKCGWGHPREIRYGHLQGRPDTYRITCPNCSYCTKEKSSMPEAIEAWNRRADDGNVR